MPALRPGYRSLAAEIRQIGRKEMAASLRFAPRARALAAWIIPAAMLAGLSALPAPAEEAASTSRIAVFDFELEDKSAGGGIIPPDEYDKKYLAESTAEAKRLLEKSGRFVVLDTGGADLGEASASGLRNCNGCEAAIARKLGGDWAMLGVVTRVNRTEYTLFIRVLDASTGEVVSRNFTNLRMGANYSWPRGVKWLMDRQVLAARK
jgi:hypothetical protein